MEVLPAPTHLGPPHVLATPDTVEMEQRVVVGLQVCAGRHFEYSSVHDTTHISTSTV